MVRIGAATAAALLLASCFAAQPPVATAAPAPGFFVGFWHGLIAPVAFLVSLFDGDVRIYAVPNVGRWYELGFMLGIGGFSGGIFAGARSKR